MGCDIHTYVEVRNGGRWEMTGPVFPLDEFGQEWEKRTHTEHPFDWRAYGMFGFLANVRNYACIPVIAEPKHSLPADVSKAVEDEWSNSDGHTVTWLMLRQLVEFNYDQVFWNRRVTRRLSANALTGAGLAEEGEGTRLTVREFLGADFFRDIEIMKTLGSLDDVRLVFWFDN